MSVTEYITQQWTRGSESLSKTTTLTGEGALDADVSVPDSSTVEVALPVDKDGLAGLYIVSDQDVTLETNDSGTPDDSFDLEADKPLVWFPGCGIPLASFLTADVTSWFITNASGSTAAVKFRLLGDVTP